MRSFAAALLSLTMAAGCTSPGHAKAVKTADRLDHLNAAIDDLRSSVTATSTALTVLITKKDQDPAQAFQQFEDAVHALEGARKRADGRLDGVRAEAEAYFITWKEQAATINDEDLKERSEERRTELSAAVDRVTEAMAPAREKIDTYLASLHDTLKYLSIDLTPQGIASIDGRAKAASKSSKAVNETLGEVLEAALEAARLFAMARATGPKKSEEADKPSN
jgi:outer membrane murein-binding lipoprotein Lpp